MRHSSGRGQRRAGIVLLAALVAIVLVSILAAGAMFAVDQLHRGTSRLVADERLDAAGELAIGSALAAWDGAARAGQPVGATTPVPLAMPGPDPPLVDVRVTRLRADLYLVAVDVRGSSSAAVGHRRVSVVVRARPDSTSLPRVVRGRGWAELL